MWGATKKVLDVAEEREGMGSMQHMVVVDRLPEGPLMIMDGETESLIIGLSPCCCYYCS